MAVEEIQDYLAGESVQVVDFSGTPTDGFGRLVSQFAPIIGEAEEIQDSFTSLEIINDIFQ